MNTSKWSTHPGSALDIATELIAPMGAFVAGVVLGGLIVVLLVAQRLPSLCETECGNTTPVWSTARPIGSAR